ncbi:MAG: oxidoreductase [Promethearchaeota archaeon]
MKFHKLVQPLQIGKLTLRNRMIMPAMHLGASEEGFVSEKIIRFYQRRAQGGVGMIIVGGIAVSRRGAGAPLMLSIEDDKYIPRLANLVQVVHKEGAKICAQLYHAGAYAYSQIIGEQAVSSSAVYSRFTHEVPRELTTTEVGEVIENICVAGERAVKAGFDSVEIVSSAGYLIDQFLSPLKNKRKDRYGGNNIQERLTFPLELIQKLKKRIGHQIIIGCRLSGDDFVPGSNTYKEKKIVAKEYAKAGIEYLNVTGGWHETRVPQLPMDTPSGAFAYLAKEIKQVVNIPVFASNRINDPRIGESLLQDFYADAICFGRPLVADPDLPKKVQTDNLTQLRYCVGCNQGCFDAIFQLKSLSCMVNPLAMNENKISEIKSIDNPKKIVIIGAGPAGLEAARVASSNGHQVIIYEKSSTIGGQINVAHVPPGREDLKRIIDYYQEQINSLPIELHLNTEVRPEKILEQNPDYILIATGVNYKIPPILGIEGTDECPVSPADEALNGNVAIGKKVVVIGGAATGVETAIWAAKKGAMDPKIARFLSFYEGLTADEAMQRTYQGDREVILLEYLPKIGNGIGKSTKWVFLDELKKLGIEVHTNVNVQRIEGNKVVYQERSLEENKTNGNMHTLTDVNNVLLATGVTPNRTIGEEILEYIKSREKQKKIEKTKKPKIKYVGDAKKVGTILDAIHSGFKAAFKLGKFDL